MFLIIIVALGSAVYGVSKDKEPPIPTSTIIYSVAGGALIGAIFGIGVGTIITLSNSDLKKSDGFVIISECAEGWGDGDTDKFGQREGGCLYYGTKKIPISEHLYNQSKIYALVFTIIGTWGIPIFVMINHDNKYKNQKKDTLPKGID